MPCPSVSRSEWPKNVAVSTRVVKLVYYVTAVAPVPASGHSTDVGDTGQSAAPARVTPKDSPSVVARRAVTLIRTEGVAGLLCGVGRLAAAAWHSVYRNLEFRIYELCVDEAASLPAMPPLDDISLHMVESREDALELARQGFENVLEVMPRTERRLGHGAVAACAFVGWEFASIDWIASSEEAKEAIDRIPYGVDFAHGEAASAAAFTVRRFRNKGIGTYRISMQARYLQARGYRVCRSSIAAANVASQRCVEKYGAQFHIVGRRRRFLWWRTWKETAVP